MDFYLPHEITPQGVLDAIVLETARRVEVLKQRTNALIRTNRKLATRLEEARMNELTQLRDFLKQIKISKAPL